jgi:hypothetical protein
MVSPTLLAKKQARDAKLKNLEDAFKYMSHVPESPLEEEETVGESSSEMTAANNKSPEYLQSSYQNNNQDQQSPDVEQGGSQGDGSTTYHTNSLSLREEVQSLIDNGSEDDRICVDPKKAFLENVGSSPQRVFMSMLFLIFLWWFL